MNLPATFLDQFDEPFGFMDFASVGAMSIPARRAAQSVVDLMAGDGGRLISDLTLRMEAARRSVAQFMRVGPEQVVMVPNTSAGLFAVAFGLEQGRVAVPETEFPANLYPWIRAAQVGRIGLDLFPVPDDRLTADQVAAACGRLTTAVSLSFVDYRSGFRADLGAIKAEIGDALLIVDAVQGLGALRLGMEHADVVVAGGHKWLRAGTGAGVMVLSEAALDRLHPTLTGWLGVADPFDSSTSHPHDPVPGATRFAAGTPGFGAVAALGAAFEILEGVSGIDVEDQVINRAQAVEEAARRSGAEVLAPWRTRGERSGIVTFRPARESSGVVHRRLQSGGLTVTERNGWLRVAPHATTHPEAPPAMGAVLAR